MRQTDTCHSIYRASIASRGKKSYRQYADAVAGDYV